MRTDSNLILSGKSFIFIMAILVVKFSRGDTIFERFLPKSQLIQRKLLNFEKWCNGEVSKSVKT